MQLVYTQYSDDLMDAVEELYLCAPPHAADLLSGLAQEHSEYSLVALGRTEAAGIAARTQRDGNRASMALFVSPKYRRSHIGTSLADGMFSSMREEGLSFAYTDYAGDDPVIAAFLDKLGFSHRYDAHFMRFRGEPPAVDPDIVKYDDSMYDEVAALIADAFEPMRKRLGITPHRIPADIQRRAGMAEHAEDIYVYIENGRIAGTGSAQDCEVDSIAVREDCRGRGIGRRLVLHGTALLAGRSMRPTLWVAEGNSALELYIKLGYYTDRLHHFYIKEL